MLLVKVLLKRSLKFRPKIVTSYRAHGRWGDIVVAIIPVFWCLNILSHSTLLLRMSEFQTETNIMTVRVRGRQWYWIYKLELSNFFSLSNKKILTNGKKQLTLSSSFRNGGLNLFQRHNYYRQYWRNWFLNKNILSYNARLNGVEMVSPESNLNDIDLKNKTKSWSLKTNRIKASWYSRSLDSNVFLYNNFPSKKSFFFRKLRRSFRFETVNSLQQSKLKKFEYQNNSNVLNYNGTYKYIQKNFNVFSYRTYDSFSKKLLTSNSVWNGMSFYTYLQHSNLDNFFKSTNQFLKFKSPLALNFNHVHKLSLNAGYFFYADSQKNFVNKTILDINKSFKVFYCENKKTLKSLLKTFKKTKLIKEPVKYTFELKPKFGFVPVKLDLVVPSTIDAGTFDKLPILILKPESEYELKNLSTVVRYFMVLDQNRRTLNRFFKLPKHEFVFRTNKINNLYDQNVETHLKQFNFILNDDSSKSLAFFDDDGNKKVIYANSPVYAGRTIKPQNSFININNLESEKKQHDLDFFSPNKYTVSSELSSTQSNIRSKKKLLYNQRLLHTTSILVLPTRLNITIITNSYDVIHSWFIPGLGLKMDCVPGRSTHHTLFIDHPGLYYGQCAEICGRFHHHMPIKIAALQWEHFLLWWYHHSMNLGVHAFLKDFNRTSLKEFKTQKVYPVTHKFISQRPVI